MTQRVRIKSTSPEIQPHELEQIRDTFDIGGYEQRLCYIILLNELEGSQAAQKQLALTDERAEQAELELTEKQQRLRDSIATLLDHYAAEQWGPDLIDRPAQDLLESQLGWLGKLVLFPADDTQQATQRNKVLGEAVSTTTKFLLIVGGVILLSLVGIATGIGLFVLFSRSQTKPAFSRVPTDHNIYVETFAIWLVVFFLGTQLFAAIIIALVGELGTMPSMLLNLAVFFGSLGALCWPVIRGIPLSQVFHDIGWKCSKPWINGSLAGLCYAVLLPVFLLVTFTIAPILLHFSSPEQSANQFTKPPNVSHPIIEEILQGDWKVLAMVLLMACVAAPIVEETMFRGVLYRHLRDLTAGRRRWLSVGISSLINGLVFAAIHPYGLVGIPGLLALAVGFSLAREWRNSLTTPMVMHGIHNFLTTVGVFLINA